MRPLLASPRFLAASSAQLDESFSDLTAFLSPGFAPGAAGAPGTALALWIVPLMPAAASTGFGGSGLWATSTFFGADIIARMAAASASAALRRPCRSVIFLVSSASASAALITRTWRTGSAGGATGAGASTTGAGAAAAAAAAAAASRAAASLADLVIGTLGLAASAAMRAASAAAFSAAFSAATLARSSASARTRASSASRARRFSASSSSCWRIRSACERASSSRRTSSASSAAAAAWACSSVVESSRWTKVRFLRTSTWMVRALPLASACLISLVDLRVSVIFLRSPPVVPCAVRK